MHNYQKQKQHKDRSLLLLAIFMAAILLAGYHISRRRQANMDAYAKRNHCTWQATGSFYGDNRDQVCN
jgi:hypothetical protein